MNDNTRDALAERLQQLYEDCSIRQGTELVVPPHPWLASRLLETLPGEDKLIEELRLREDATQRFLGEEGNQQHRLTVLARFLRKRIWGWKSE